MLSWMSTLATSTHQPFDNANSRNGCSGNALLTEDGAFDVVVPRDCDSSFEPQIVRKHQTQLIAMDGKIHCLYAKGMTTREIVATFKGMYDADVSPTLVSKVTDLVESIRQKTNSS